MNFITKLASGAAIGALMLGSAEAADIGSLKDDGPDFGSARTLDFSGPYAGVGVGGMFLGGDPENNNGTIGGVVEGVIGWDFRRASFVIGPRIVGGLTNLDDEREWRPGNTALDAFLNFGGRAGVVFNRTLVYAHGGYEIAFASSDDPDHDAYLGNADLNAITGGFGIETMLADRWSLAAEGTYISGINDAEDTDGWRGVFRINHQF